MFASVILTLIFTLITFGVLAKLNVWISHEPFGMAQCLKKGMSLSKTSPEIQQNCEAKE